MTHLAAGVLALALPAWAQAAPTSAPPRGAEAEQDGWDTLHQILAPIRVPVTDPRFAQLAWERAMKAGLDPDRAMAIVRSALESGLLGSGPGGSAPEGRSPLTVAEGLASIAIRENPERPGYRRTRAKLRRQRRDHAGVFEDLDHVVRGEAPDPQTLTDYGQAAYELGDNRLARDAAALALKMQPDNPAAFALYQLTEGRASRITLPSSLGGPTAGPQLVAAPAAPSVASPAPGQAVPAAAPAATTAPDTAERLSQAATENARHALGVKDFPLAVHHASRAVELNPRNAQALNFRAIAYNRMRRYADAVADASAALGLAPESGAALQTRSWAFAQQGRYGEALQDADATLRGDPRNAFAYQNRAFALAGLGDRAGALAALRASAQLDARFAGAYERAVRLPQDQDLTLLFDERLAEKAPAAAPRPPATAARFARLALFTGTGGLLIALGILHIASASWREKVTMTVRRILGRPLAAAAVTAPASGATAFWTQYDLVKEIGMGGMGVVYEATDRALERRVAVKKMRDELRADPRERQRFVTEAKLVAQLRHPSIVDIYAIIEDGSDVYLVFEYVEGRTLHDRLRSEGAYGYAEGLRAFRDVCAAVEHAHSAQIVHRDLKPSNIMVTSDGRIKVMDFGVARQAKDALTRMSMTNTVAGTPPYMAPEQEQGTVRRESDVYALAVCFYEMLTGQLPFAGTGATLLLNKINGRHIPPTQRVPSLPGGLDAVMAKALSPNPDKRHRTPGELLKALEPLTG